jgi:hypothetical protein
VPLATGTRVPCVVDQPGARFEVGWTMHTPGHEGMLQEVRLPETELAAHEPPMSFKKCELQPVYSSQWLSTQVMPDQS